MGNWEMVSYIGMMRNSSQDVVKGEPSGKRTTQYKASKILRVKKRKKRTFFVGVSETVCHQSALALLTRMSTLPNLVTVFVTHSMHACSERRSRMTGKAVAPVFNAAISSATVYMVPGSVGCTVADFAATTTLHPCFANARHTALPIFCWCFGDGVPPKRARVVDQDVDFAEPCDCFRDALDARLLGA